jgi:hypothetical protein
VNEGPPPSRLTFCLLLAAGVGVLFWQWSMLRAEGKFYGKLLLMVILLIPVCVAGVFDPKLLNPWHSHYADKPNILKYKIAASVAGICLVGLALYVVIALSEGWWLPKFIWGAFGPG